MEQKIFSIANFAIVKDILGPHLRLVVWSQGCKARCINCQTPEYQAIKENNFSLKMLKQVFDDAIKQGINGVTVSGGEPFLQPLVIQHLGKLIAEHNKSKNDNMDFLVYTGLLYEKLQKTQKSTLKNIDVLVDGQYKPSEDLGEGLRGSANQRIIFITHRGERLKEKYLDLLKERKSQVVFTNGRFISIGLKN